MATWPKEVDKRLATVCPDEDCGAVNIFTLSDEQAQDIADMGEATCVCDCGEVYTVDVAIPEEGE